ncbi:cilia- and flagella-associated protein 43-like [Xyrauchen texanus]|uniref:cilia- and flagella-associated protein 43-like n=1 Tax=Xyrauchen texanus TaxID=154827 RepID=UPI002241F13D|nr:cilia- and flagella-associated protein 43-like [Xyrauchen texanus]
MMQENESLEDMEKLMQQEFNLYVGEQERLQVEGEQDVTRGRKEIKMENLSEGVPEERMLGFHESQSESHKGLYTKKKKSRNQVWEHKRMRVQLEDLSNKARNIQTLSVSHDIQECLNETNSHNRIKAAHSFGEDQRTAVNVTFAQYFLSTLTSN